VHVESSGHVVSVMIFANRDQNHNFTLGTAPGPIGA